MTGWMFIGVGLIVTLTAAALLIRYPAWFWPWLRGTVALAALSTGVLGMVTGWTVLQWQEVSLGEPLQSLAISRGGNKTWQISVRSAERGRSLRINGDLLEVRGRLLVLETPIKGLGAVMRYHLDGLTGRMTGTDTPLQYRGNSANDWNGWGDAWEWDRTLSLPLVRAESLFPAYLPLVDGASFDIVLQGHQLEAVPANEVAERALESPSG